jgi:arginyl-tRNA synthetase
LKQMQEVGVQIKGMAKYELLVDHTEVELIKKLGEYPDLIANAAQDRAVHRVAFYVQELAGLFHSFYNQCRIIGVDNDLQQARLALILVVKHVLEHALGILGVSAPDHM